MTPCTVDVGVCERLDLLNQVSTATNGYLWYFIVFALVYLFFKIIWSIASDFILF